MRARLGRPIREFTMHKQRRAQRATPARGLNQAIAQYRTLQEQSQFLRASEDEHFAGCERGLAELVHRAAVGHHLGLRERARIHALLFDNLVGAREERCWDGDPQCIRDFEIDRELETRWQFDG